MAVHVLSALAHNQGRQMGSDDLARTVGTNPSFLRGLVGQLKDAGLVQTTRGKAGGTRLARPAARITLQDVYLATESLPAVKTHHCDGRSRCPVARGVNHMLSEVNDRVEKALERELKAMTIADLVASYIPD